MTFAKQQHAADLMIPSEVMIFDKLPMLGSGKVDLIALAKLVAERTAAKPEAWRACRREVGQRALRLASPSKGEADPRSGAGGGPASNNKY